MVVSVNIENRNAVLNDLWQSFKMHYVRPNVAASVEVRECMFKSTFFLLQEAIGVPVNRYFPNV
jgi:hypothetical protein